MDSNDVFFSKIQKDLLKKQLENIQDCDIISLYFSKISMYNMPYTHRLDICVSNWKLGTKREYDPPNFHIDMYYSDKDKINYKITNYYLNTSPHLYRRNILLEERIEMILVSWCKEVFVGNHT
jgi:hypothetical protein